MTHPGRRAAAAVLVCGWGGNQFTPLLVMYREAGLSVVAVDALLGAYVVGLVPGLLVAGRLSGRWGRKPVMITGVVLSLAASLLLSLGDLGAGWIAAGRLVTGLGVALAMGVGSTWVTELSARHGDSRALGARRGALWLTVGFGAGAGVAGALAQWGPAPSVLPYLVHAGVALAVLAVVASLPETRTGAPASSGSEGHRHPRFRRVVTPMAPWIFGAAGVAYAVMPQLVGDHLGRWGLAYSTLLTVCTLAVGAAIQPLAKRLDRLTSARAVVVGMATMAVGLGVSVVVAVVRSPVVALVAALVLGAAYGIAMVSGLLELQRLARPVELPTLVGIYYALAYSGFLLPSILAVLSAVASYAVLLTGLMACALIGMAVVLRHSRRHLPAPG
ncbi:MFS transporter [Actinomycetospora sp. C-140]